MTFSDWLERWLVEMIRDQELEDESDWRRWCVEAAEAYEQISWGGE